MSPYDASKGGLPDLIRATKCTTHHHACACREAELSARITQLERDLSEARRERDEARAQLDTYIKTAADAVAEQGRCEAAGRVLAACYFWRSEGAVAFLNSDKMVMRVNIKINEADDAVQANTLALAWVKAAQEASQS